MARLIADSPIVPDSVRALAGARLAELAVYCTGDWDQARQAEHAAAVTLIRP